MYEEPTMLSTFIPLMLCLFVLMIVYLFILACRMEKEKRSQKREHERELEEPKDDVWLIRTVHDRKHDRD